MNEPSKPKKNSVEAHFHLANVWQLKGQVELAIAHYRQALRLEPDYAPAYQKLGQLMREVGQLEEALTYFEKAVALKADDRESVFHCQYVRDLLRIKADNLTRHSQARPDKKRSYLKDHPKEKINLHNQVDFQHHRSGWAYALNALAPLHNSQGVLFDGFIENNFSRQHWRNWANPPRTLEKMKCQGTFDRLATSEEKGITPYAEPWVGIAHNPPSMPTWFNYQRSPQVMFAKDIWKRSLEHCIGLFALSQYHAQWLGEQTGKPVSTLVHPTEIPELRFDFERFLDNPRKKIIQIGWWLRKQNAIHQLPVGRDNPLNYEKIKLIPFDRDVWELHTVLAAKEMEVYNLEFDPLFAENTREMASVPDMEYDALLSENIVFMDLYDTSANNVTVECLARATPLLVNPLPAVVEYLGEDYPMYFTDLSEAADKALDTALIQDTHNYLRNWEVRENLSAAYFLQRFRESEVYQLV